MYFNDHAPPHFHAEYGGAEVVIDIDTMAIIAGRLPPRAMGLVTEWAALHQSELRDDWQRASNLDPLEKIDPLA